MVQLKKQWKGKRRFENGEAINDQTGEIYLCHKAGGKSGEIWNSKEGRKEE